MNPKLVKFTFDIFSVIIPIGSVLSEGITGTEMIGLTDRTNGMMTICIPDTERIQVNSDRWSSKIRKYI